MTVVSLGDGLLVFWSLASRIAAMIEAAITSVDANRSAVRLCSSIAFFRSCSSRAIARLIRPTDYLTPRTCRSITGLDSLP